MGARVTAARNTAVARTTRIAAYDNQVAYDPTCYLCPGNTRISGEANPTYSNTYVFDNDTPALLSEAVDQPGATSPLFQQ